MVQLLQSTTRLLECPWLQQQHRSAVEACIRTLAMVGKDLPQGHLCPQPGDPPPLGAAGPAANTSHLHPARGSPGNGDVGLWDVLVLS